MVQKKLILVIFVILISHLIECDISSACINKPPSTKMDFSKNQPRPDQKSLVMAFDTTGSMGSELEQVKESAQEIVQEMTARSDSPIYNYILVAFNNPNVDEAVITKNKNDALNNIKKIGIQSKTGGGCAEMAMLGLKKGVEAALPNSIVYVFTDASAADIHLYSEVEALIRKKQITVNFLLTGDCGEKNTEKYQVYFKISRVSGGQVYEIARKNVKSVFMPIKEDLNPNFVLLKTVKTESSETKTINFDVDLNLEQLKISVIGPSPTLSVYDPSNNLVTGSTELSLETLKLLTVKNPTKGKWRIQTYASSSYNVVISGMSSLHFSYGFSLKPAEKLSQTNLQPLSGFKNIISIFVSNMAQVKQLASLEIVTVPLSSSERSTETIVPLKHLKDNVFVTDPFDIPNQPFTVKLNGPDSNGNLIERVFPSPIVATSGSAPELSIKTDKMDFFETGNIELSCVVKSQIPIEIAWTLNGNILKKVESSESNELKLSIKNIKFKDSGVYKCAAVNKINCETQEINVDVLAAPNLKIISSSDKMVENSSYTLTCQLDDTKGLHIDYSWFDGDNNILQNSGQTYTFKARLEQDKQRVKCKAKSSGFELEDSLLLDVDYSPRFLEDESKLNKFVYGSGTNFDCTTVEKPKRNPVKWQFKAKGSTENKLISGQNEGILKIVELFEKDIGEYECIVSNTVGEVRRKFSVALTPKGIPQVTTANKLIIKNVTESVELYCECNDCLPITNFLWTFDNSKTYEVQSIKDEENDYFKTFIEIDEITVEDAGQFHCQLTNELGSDSLEVELRVQKPPIIERILLNNDETEIKENFEILEGESMTLECIADGLPIPDVSWFKDTYLVSSKSIISIANVSISDEGYFECGAENLLGAEIKAVHLDVNFPPRREKDIETAFIVIEGREASLNCNLIGKPVPEISWLFNSKEIEANDKFEIVGKTLKFTAEPDDSGIYKCVGVNAFGNASIEFPGIVKTFPRIFSSSDEIIKVENNTYLELPCDATGYPQPTVKFTLNNTDYTDKSPLIIKSVIPSDSGSYHCIAENEVGTDEKIFYVTVVKRPAIITCLKNITLYTNQTEKILCGAVGISEPTIKWKYNDVDILSTEELVTLSSTHKSGKISCIAENSEGEDVKSFYLETINVPNLLPIANDLQTNISIREGYDLDLLCPFENYNIIEWTFNDTELSVSDFKQIGKRLMVFNVESSHGGLWTCTASNTEGNQTFSFNVKVLTAPTVLASWNFNMNISDFEANKINLDQRSFKMADNLTMNCTVDGSPVPNVEWRKGIDFIGRGEVLSINSLQFHHSDIYTCSAENTQGIILKYFKVDVRSAPYVDTSVNIQKNFLSYVDDTEILRCSSIHGNPKPLFIWLKDNEIIEDAMDDHLVIDKIKLSDQGKYRCIGRNELGSAKIDYILDVYEPAQILRAVEEERTSKEDESVKLSCTVRANPLPIVSWTFNGHIYTTTSRVKVDEVFINSTDNIVYFDSFGNGINYLDPFKLHQSSEKYYSKLTKIDLKTLKLDIIYKNPKDILHLRQFNCYTFNALGRDEKSVNIKVTQKPYIEKQDLVRQKDLEILEHMPMELHCLVEGYPKPVIKWYRDGEEIHNNETIKFIDNRRILTVPETYMWNSGSYKCLAENDEGKLEVNFNVLILSPPKITQPARISRSPLIDIYLENMETKNVSRGGDISLECFVEASPKANIYWTQLDDYESSEKNIILREDVSILTLNAVHESSYYMCYANNTIGFTKKIFYINVQYPPEFTEGDESDEYLTVKLHHSFTLDCKVTASPEAKAYWTYNSNALNNGNGFLLAANNQALKVINANKNHEGKYTCTVMNEIGHVQKNFYIRLEILVQYTSWSKWSECNVPCGLDGIQYRRRTCISDGEHPSYNCSGETIQRRSCNELPCPVNGGWSSWSDFSECPSCYDALDSDKPYQRRTRSCDSPAPSYGGLQCRGDDVEEQECEIKVCTIDGGWSDWTDWSACSTTCERGIQVRYRYCNNPKPSHNGKTCPGHQYETKYCMNAACPITTTTVKPLELETSKPTRNGLTINVFMKNNEQKPEINYDESINDVKPYGELRGAESEINCGQGLRFNRAERLCEDIDECREFNPCKKNEKCININRSYRCHRV